MMFHPLFLQNLLSLCQNVSFESVDIFSVIHFSFSSKLIVTLVRLDTKGVCALNVIDLNNHHRIPKFPSLPFANNRKSGSADGMTS